MSVALVDSGIGAFAVAVDIADYAAGAASYSAGTGLICIRSEV